MHKPAGGTSLLWVIYVPLALLVLFAIFGYAAGPQGQSMLEEMAGFVRAWELSGTELILLIFVNNALKAFLVLVLGLGLGVFPVLFLAVNGVVLGQVIAEVVSQHGLMLAITGLAPHGVLEIPAVIIAAGFGLRLGVEVGGRFVGRPSQVRPWLRSGLRTYLRVVLPLLVIASVIEVVVTPWLAAPFV